MTSNWVTVTAYTLTHSLTLTHEESLWPMLACCLLVVWWWWWRARTDERHRALYMSRGLFEAFNPLSRPAAAHFPAGGRDQHKLCTDGHGPGLAFQIDQPWKTKKKKKKMDMLKRERTPGTIPSYAIYFRPSHKHTHTPQSSAISTTGVISPPILWDRRCGRGW